MSKEQVVEEIWKLSIWEVFYVAMMDDWILLVKLWPLWVIVLLVFIGGFLYEKLACSERS